MNEVLIAKNLSKTFTLGGKSIVALKDVSLTFKEGESVSIMGPSGAGKSTLLYLLGLIDTSSAGKITLMGQDATDISSRRKSKFRSLYVGFVFQSFYLLPELNCLQNVCLPAFIRDKKNFWNKQEVHKKARIMLEKVGMSERIMHKPTELSGGEMQRVAICRSLINDPPVVLADEPTGNLDSKNSEIVADLLFSISREKNKTLIIATHNETLAGRADKIVKLVDGRILNS